MAPEYALWGYLTYKADVYSFGIVALEIVAGKNSMKFQPDEYFVCLLEWVRDLQQNFLILKTKSIAVRPSHLFRYFSIWHCIVFFYL